MRTGYTLLELALVLAITGLLLGISLPRFAAIRDSLDVDHAARQIVTAHRRARVTAIVRGRPVVLTVRADSLLLQLAGDTEPVWAAAGPLAAGVAMAGPARKLTFSPVGISVGVSNASFRLTRGQAGRTVVVSRLGRVRVTTP